MTKKQLNKFIETYQSKLRLNDWDIRFQYTNTFSGGQTGSASVREKMMSANILLGQGLSDTELKRTIVHELLHVRFGAVDWPEGSAMELSFEVGIEMIARALLGE